MHEHTFQIWSNREMQWMVNPHTFSRYWAEVVPYSCVVYSPLFPFCRANHYMIWASLQQSQLPKVVLAFHSFIPACTCTCAQTSGALPPYHWIAYQTQSRKCYEKGACYIVNAAVHTYITLRLLFSIDWWSRHWCLSEGIIWWRRYAILFDRGCMDTAGPGGIFLTSFSPNG